MAKNKKQPRLVAGICYRVNHDDDPQRSFLLLDQKDGGETWVIIEQGENDPKDVELDDIWPRGSQLERIDPHEIGRRSADDAAEWLWNTIKKDKSLEQEVAASHIQDEFGIEFVYETEIGNIGIDRRVLYRFKKLHDGAVEYFTEGGYGYWEM